MTIKDKGQYKKPTKGKERISCCHLPALMMAAIIGEGCWFAKKKHKTGDWATVNHEGHIRFQFSNSKIEQLRTGSLSVQRLMFELLNFWTTDSPEVGSDWARQQPKTSQEPASDLLRISCWSHLAEGRASGVKRRATQPPLPLPSPSLAASCSQKASPFFCTRMFDVQSWCDINFQAS